MKDSLKNQDIYGAFFIIRRALEYNPKNYQLLMYQCNIMSDMGYYNEAKDCYDNMLSTLHDNYVMSQEDLDKALETTYNKIKKGLESQGVKVKNDSFRKKV